MALHFILVDSEFLGGKPWAFAVDPEDGETYFFRDRAVEEVIVDDETVWALMAQQSQAFLAPAV